MPFGGRDTNPGESDIYNQTRDHARYLSRVVSGQISDVTPGDGKVTVSSLREAGSFPVTISPLWFSATPSSPITAANPNPPPKTAWGRYMPMGNEHVEIGYHNDDTPYILGYNITATEDESRAGYPALRKLQEQGAVGYAGFRRLKPGEFDFKSVGDAYMHGSAFGTMFIAGGQAFIRLDKQAYRIDSKASEYKFISDTSELRVGTVFRKVNPTDAVETAVPPTGTNISFKEFLVDLNDSIAGFAAPQSKLKIHGGDILTSTNTPELSSSGAPLRFRMSVGDVANATEAFKLEIDALGNIVWDQNITGLNGLSMSMFKLELNTNSTILMEAVAQADYNAPITNIGASAICTINSPAIFLGGTSIESVIKGVSFGGAFTAHLTQEIGLMATTGAALSAAAADPVLAALMPVAATSLATAGATLITWSTLIPVFQSQLLTPAIQSINTFTK
jgi:hypothetical protein